MKTTLLRKTSKLFMALLIFICFGAKTYAAIQQLDDFSSNESKKNVVEYSANLLERPGNGLDFPWKLAPDKTFLSTSQGSNVDASATYAISGVEKLYVSIYNNVATYATEDNGTPNKFVLGYKNGAEKIKNKFDVQYSHNDTLIYSYINGEWYSFDEKSEIFAKVKNVPSDIINYGLQIYVSADKNKWSNVDRFYRLSENDASYETGSIKKMAYYYENFFYMIPPNTKYIKITINGFGKLTPKTNILRLAEAKAEGKNIVIGEVETPPLPPIIPSSSAPTPSSSDKPNGGGATNKPSSSKPSSSSKKSSSSKSSSSKSSSSKIVYSKSSSSKSVSSKKSGGSEAITDEVDVNAGYNEDKNSVSKITQIMGAEPAENENDQLGTGAIAVMYGGVVLIGVVSFALKLK